MYTICLLWVIVCYNGEISNSEIPMSGQSDNADNFNQRFDQALKHAQISYSELARRLGISRQVINHWRSRQTMPAKYIADFERVVKASGHWVMTGEGEMANFAKAIDWDAMHTAVISAMAVAKAQNIELSDPLIKGILKATYHELS